MHGSLLSEIRKVPTGVLKWKIHDNVWWYFVLCRFVRLNVILILWYAKKKQQFNQPVGKALFKNNILSKFY